MFNRQPSTTSTTASTTAMKTTKRYSKSQTITTMSTTYNNENNVFYCIDNNNYHHSCRKNKNSCNGIGSVYYTNFPRFTILLLVVVLLPHVPIIQCRVEKHDTHHLISNSNNTPPPPRYGVDCSFPIHYSEFRCFAYSNTSTSTNCYNNHIFANERIQAYNDYIEGCRRKYGKRRRILCDENESLRMENNIQQPRIMINYTYHGYKKFNVPTELYALLLSNYRKSNNAQPQNVNTLSSTTSTTSTKIDQLHQSDSIREEIWNIGDTFTNHWDAPTYIIPIDDTNNSNTSSSKKAGVSQQPPNLKAQIWNSIRMKMEQWTGMEQRPVSMYGIRQYTSGAIIAPHVTRLPLVCSCIICIDDGTSSSSTTNSTDDGSNNQVWPIELYDRSGYAMNITLRRGEMLFYESSSVIYGRPFPLQQKYYAELYIHFEPTGHRIARNDFYPPYLVRDSPQMYEWIVQHQQERQEKENQNRRDHQKEHEQLSQSEQEEMIIEQQYGLNSKNKQFRSSPEAHVAAAIGDVDSIRQLGKINAHLLLRRDVNGWQPIHEATKAEHFEVIKVLVVEFNVDINARTGLHGDGHTPLSIAVDRFGKHHSIAQSIVSLGGKVPAELELQQRQQQYRNEL